MSKVFQSHRAHKLRSRGSLHQRWNQGPRWPRGRRDRCQQQYLDRIPLFRYPILGESRSPHNRPRTNSDLGTEKLGLSILLPQCGCGRIRMPPRTDAMLTLGDLTQVMALESFELVRNSIGCGSIHASDGVQKCHQSATRTKRQTSGILQLTFKLLILLSILVALPGLEPGLFALRGRRVNQLHHNATERMRNP
jgi:hypothetical protein